MCESRVEKWVKLALENEDLHSYEIRETGKTGKADGYLGNIFFVAVSGKTSKNEPKTLNFAIKASKDSENLRNQIPVQLAFYKEIFIYDSVYKAFDNFQKLTTSQNLLDFLPHCYVTQITDQNELLIFENLNKEGFRNHNRKVPMDLEHLKLVLEAYGKWHSFSFAMRSRSKEQFQNLIKNNINMFGYFCIKANFAKMFLDNFIKTRDVCIAENERHILEKLDFTTKNLNYFFNDMYFEDLDFSVISHGDCWNNNFLFGYAENESKPFSARIIDWQCSGFSSPAFDLSHFIYACCDTHKYRDVSILLKIYYESFRKSLEALNCNPEELFSYSKLVKHWRRFSRFGILLQAFILKFAVCEAEDAPDLAEAANEGKEIFDSFDVEVKNEKEYHSRIRSNLMHYVENLNIS